MYAIVECGGKQYKVQKDMLFKVEKIDAEVGSEVSLKVLFVSNDDGSFKAGSDAESCSVKATVNAQGKSRKVLVFKYKAKKQIRKCQGHRQPYTELKVVSIEG